MKLYLHSRITALLLSLLLAVGASAANDTHKGSLQIGTPVAVNGKQLPPGSYQLAWEGAGPNVALNIMQDGKVVATTPAHVVDLTEKSTDNVADLRTGTDGKKSLSEIRFSGKKYALAIGEETAQTQPEVKTGNSNK